MYDLSFYIITFMIKPKCILFIPNIFADRIYLDPEYMLYHGYRYPNAVVQQRNTR